MLSLEAISKSYGDGELALYRLVHGTGFGRYEYSVRPAALALYWAIGPLIPLLFFLLDSALVSSHTTSNWFTPAVTGLVAMTAGTALLWRLASRSLRRYLEAPCV